MIPPAKNLGRARASISGHLKTEVEKFLATVRVA
jgi:hypothetical protein